MSKTIGIDLDTTFSVVAHLNAGRPEVIPGKDDSALTPSVVGIRKDKSRVVGRAAMLQAEANPDGTVFSIKRRMGRRRYSPLKAHEDKLDSNGLTPDEHAVRHIKRRMGTDYRIMINGMEYTPEEISAAILKKLKDDAEGYLGEKIDKAVVTVPAYFNVSQRQATIDAGVIAGLDVIRIIDEPTAAALAYGLEIEDVQTVMVWDLGGGTFDVSILELGAGLFEVKAVSGDTLLGGDDYDQRIADHLVSELKMETGIDLAGDAAAMIRIKDIAERAKMELAESEVAAIDVPFTGDNGERRRFETFLTRGGFEKLTSGLLHRMIEPTEQALKCAGLEPSDIDRVLLVGGSSRMPQVRRLLRELMGKEPYADINPDEVVAMGAAIQAGILTGQIKGKILIDVIPISLGIETEGGGYVKIMEKNTQIPASRSRIFTNSADDQGSMNIHVLQGERASAASNMTLARFDLCGISAGKRGDAFVEVRFDINADGILNVSAKDLQTEISSALRVSPRFFGLTDSEINRMKGEAQDCAEKDRTELEQAKAVVTARSMISAAKRFVEESGCPGSRKEFVPALIKELHASILKVESALAQGDRVLTEAMTAELERRIKAMDMAGRGGFEKMPDDRPSLPHPA
ncbi:MAG: molecular chaperone DnaK [Deltaproteobacteria bacterium]|nr:molecular chaperone DnaK [Deltaproteobacteria bacterium]